MKHSFKRTWDWYKRSKVKSYLKEPLVDGSTKLRLIKLKESLLNWNIRKRSITIFTTGSTCTNTIQLKEILYRRLVIRKIWLSSLYRLLNGRKMPSEKSWLKLCNQTLWLHTIPTLLRDAWKPGEDIPDCRTTKTLYSHRLVASERVFWQEGL